MTALDIVPQAHLFNLNLLFWVGWLGLCGVCVCVCVCVCVFICIHHNADMGSVNKLAGICSVLPSCG